MKITILYISFLFLLFCAKTMMAQTTARPSQFVVVYIENANPAKHLLHSTCMARYSDGTEEDLCKVSNLCYGSEAEPNISKFELKLLEYFSEKNYELITCKYLKYYFKHK